MAPPRFTCGSSNINSPAAREAREAQEGELDRETATAGDYFVQNAMQIIRNSLDPMR
jgi:hypothetical protein